MPKPFDLYDRWQIPTNPAEPLSHFQQTLILSAFPPGAQIREATPAREWAFYPIRVKVVKDNREQTVY
jgi:hypothetical protein